MATGWRKWTKDETDILRKWYGYIPYKQIQELYLPHKSIRSMQNRARHVGLTSNEPGQKHMMSLSKKQYSLNYEYFSHPNSENSYWAGFLAADGTIMPEWKRICLELQERDKHHIHLFAHQTQCDSPIKSRIRTSPDGKTFTNQEITVCGAFQWIEDLERDFNVGPQKTTSLEPPANLNHLQDQCFLRGLIDGDGHIGINTYGPKLTILNTQPILEWARDIFSQISPVIHRGNSIRPRYDGSVYELTVSGRRAAKILSRLLMLETPCLWRKWEQLTPDVLAEDVKSSCTYGHQLIPRNVTYNSRNSKVCLACQRSKNRGYQRLLREGQI